MSWEVTNAEDQFNRAETWTEREEARSRLDTARTAEQFREAAQQRAELAAADAYKASWTVREDSESGSRSFRDLRSPLERQTAHFNLGLVMLPIGAGYCLYRMSQGMLSPELFGMSSVWSVAVFITVGFLAIYFRLALYPLLGYLVYRYLSVWNAAHSADDLLTFVWHTSYMTMFGVIVWKMARMRGFIRSNSARRARRSVRTA